MLDAPPVVTPVQGVSPAFARATSFGSPVIAGLTYSFSFAQGSLPSVGTWELGGQVTNTDAPGSGSSTLFVSGGLGNSTPGAISLNDDSSFNGATDFFEQNLVDLADPGSTASWEDFVTNILTAGQSVDIDLGSLYVGKFLAYVDALGPGLYDGVLDIGLAGYDATTGAALDPDPDTGMEIPRIPGPPTILIHVEVTPGGPPPEPGVPEPGTWALLAGMGLAALPFARRRR